MSTDEDVAELAAVIRSTRTVPTEGDLHEWSARQDAETARTILASPWFATQRRAAESVHRDLVSRLGFGDNITEPMADNDTIVAWFEERSSEVNEWVESQLWRNDCYEAGCPELEDCYVHDPARRLEAAEAAVARGEACPYGAGDHGPLIRQAQVEALRAMADELAVDSSLTDSTRRPTEYADARDDERVDNVGHLRDSAAVLALGLDLS